MSDDGSADDSPTVQILDQNALRARDRDRTRLADETILSGRYRIVRFISQGGMGAVYEAEDLQLRERVALKTVRSAIAAQPGGLARFKREIQLARRVTHPNVCRIFEFGTHPLPVGQVAFLTMELLSGETLAERIKGNGALAAAEALSIGRQLAAALAAAHAAGVIHRDLKASNVMLSANAQGEPRAVVSDFGLAQGAAPADAAADAPEEVVGTLAYMAPEQIQGGTVTAAADVYALGVLFHEMVTGVKPFSGDSPISAAVERQQAPPSPRRLAPGLDPLWEAVIQTCLQPDPANRYSSAAELQRALDGPRKPWLTRPILGLGALAALVVAVLLGLPARREASPPSPAAPSGTAVKPRRSVAVLGFKNLTGRAEIGWLSTALSEMFTTELAAGNRLRSIPGETVARGRLELALPETDSLALDSLKRVRNNLGADVVIVGSYLGVTRGPVLQFRLDVRAQETDSGEIISSFSETGSDAELFTIVSKAGTQLRQALGTAPLNASEAREASSTISANPEARRLYAEGLERLRAFDALGATDCLTASVAADPTFPLAHAALSDAWSVLGYEERALNEARLAFDHSRRLPREDRLVIEARFREVSKQREKAAEIWRVLCEFFPDSLEHGVKLAIALNTAGRPQDAIETLAALRQLPGSAASDPRIDLAEAAIAQSLGDFQREREAARRAAALGDVVGARLLVARARVFEAYASGRIGMEDEATAAAREARQLFAAAGDRGGEAWALNREGNVLFQQGQLSESLRTYEEAQSLFEKIDYRAGLASLANNISETLVLKGDLTGARRMLERSHASAGATLDPRTSIVFLLNSTNLAAERGEFATARDAYERVLAQCTALGDKSLVASAIRHRSDMLLSLGELAEAKSGYEQAIEGHQRMANLRYVAYGLYGLGQVQRDQGSPADARASQDRALRIREQLHDIAGVAESQLAIAQLSLDEARPDAVLGLLGQALPIFAAQGMRDREAEAQALAAEAQRALGRTREAAESIGRADALAERTERPTVRMRVALAKVQAQLAGDAGRQKAESVREEAERLGYRGFVLQARLALSELGSHRVDTGAEARARVEEDARRLGYIRIAQSALARAGSR